MKVYAVGVQAPPKVRATRGGACTSVVRRARNAKFRTLRGERPPGAGFLPLVATVATRSPESRPPSARRTRLEDQPGGYAIGVDGGLTGMRLACRIPETDTPAAFSKGNNPPSPVGPGAEKSGPGCEPGPAGVFVGQLFVSFSRRAASASSEASVPPAWEPDEYEEDASDAPSEEGAPAESASRALATWALCASQRA